MIELSVVVPTYNEKANIGPLVERLQIALAGIEWEVIFVDDDSPDGTADTVRQVSNTNPRVRCIQRIGRRGLSSACVEGMLSSAAPYCAVMDADLQHDEAILPQMLHLVSSQQCDIAVGSRYVEGGGTGDWDSARAGISSFATRIAQQLTGTQIADVMSGFFLLRRESVEPALRQVSGLGFKILLDIVLRADRNLTVKEVPYTFKSRVAGDSKFDIQAAWQFCMMFADHYIGNFIPVRFLSFILIGGSGVLVHLLVLTLSFQSLGASFLFSQGLATLVAMTSNFALNNALTYSDKRLRGMAALKGWFTFCVACGLGAVANVGVANYLFVQEFAWLGSATVGILLGAVWNYAITSAYTWKN